MARTRNKRHSSWNFALPLVKYAPAISCKIINNKEQRNKIEYLLHVSKNISLKSEIFVKNASVFMVA